MNKNKSKSKSKTKSSITPNFNLMATTGNNIPNSKTSSKSRKISQRKIDTAKSKSKDPIGSHNLLSPKTIEYSKSILSLILIFK
jgi:hypothetical protein